MHMKIIVERMIWSKQIYMIVRFLRFMWNGTILTFVDYKRERKLIVIHKQSTQTKCKEI